MVAVKLGGPGGFATLVPGPTICPDADTSIPTTSDPATAIVFVAFITAALSNPLGPENPKARQHFGFDLFGFVRRRFTFVGTIKHDGQQFAVEVVEKLIGILDAAAPSTVIVECILTRLHARA